MNPKLVQELIGPYSKFLLDLVLVMEELQDLGFDAELAPEDLHRSDREKLYNADKQVVDALMRTVKNPTYQKLSTADKLLTVVKIFNRHRLPVLNRLQKL